MHALLLGTILLARATTSGPSTGLPGSTEAPRASDLLRAKRMAAEAAARLEVHPPKRSGWVRGGVGWERGTGDPKAKLPSARRVR